jgi:hypothetical protein
MKGYFAAMLLVMSIACVGLAPDNPAPARATGPINQEMYVWQRGWSGPLQQAIVQASPKPAGLVVLAGEVSFDENDRVSNEFYFVPTDYSGARNTGIPIGLAFRIGPWSGEFKKDQEPASTIINMAGSIVSKARRQGATVKELQIDFDCAESKLGSYLILIDAMKYNDELRDANGDIVPIIITALPCWLGHPEFKALVEEADGFVLQVHSLEEPKNINDKITLCDTVKAKQWIEQASRVSQYAHFRLAGPRDYERPRPDIRPRGVDIAGPSSQHGRHHLVSDACPRRSAQLVVADPCSSDGGSGAESVAESRGQEIRAWAV